MRMTGMSEEIVSVAMIVNGEPGVYQIMEEQNCLDKMAGTIGGICENLLSNERITSLSDVTIIIQFAKE